MLEGSLVGDGKLLAALLAAGSQYPATIGGGHAFAEAVLVLSLAAGRLIGTFHGRLKLGVQRCYVFSTYKSGYLGASGVSMLRFASRILRSNLRLLSLQSFLGKSAFVRPGRGFQGD